MNPDRTEIRYLAGRRQRPLGSVPATVRMMLITGLILQIIWHSHQSEVGVRVKRLSPPPPPAVVQLLSLDDPITAGKLIMLWLQAFDNQPGISIPLKQLNYDRLISWLELILTLDPRSQYPLLAAGRIYSYHPDPEKKRQMLDFIHHQFLEYPEARWPWMTHAVILARHQLNDLDYALELAKSLRQHTTRHSIPDWARQMEAVIPEARGKD